MYFSCFPCRVHQFIWEGAVSHIPSDFPHLVPIMAASLCLGSLALDGSSENDVFPVPQQKR